MTKRLARALLVAAGTLCVALAVFGLFVPLLPTTPLLLLAAVCYARSSERFYRWLMTNRWFGAYIRNYREGRGIPLWHKVAAISLLWLTIGYAACAVVSQWWVKGILLAVAIAVTVHLLKTETARPGLGNRPLCDEYDGPQDPA